MSGDPRKLPAFLTPDAAGVASACRVLRSGKVVALPTETVYGLAGDALDTSAVRKIFQIKGRPLIDPLIIHGKNVADLSTLAEFTPAARKLATAFWPGPLTLVLRKKAVVPDLVTAGRETVAVRVPAHPAMLAVLAACGAPLAAPSANPFGYLSPTCAAHVRTSLGARVPWIMDGGPCTHGVESTIVDMSVPARAPLILRPGPVTRKDIERVLGRSVKSARPPHAATIAKRGLRAPGMMQRHYSPDTPLRLFKNGGHPPALEIVDRARIACVKMKRPGKAGEPMKGVEVFWLSEDGSLATVGRELYALLRRLDTGRYSAIWCERPPRRGMGIALNDRLNRASQKRRT